MFNEQEYNKRMEWTKGFHQIRNHYEIMLRMTGDEKEAQLITIEQAKPLIARMGELYRELKLDKYYENN